MAAAKQRRGHRAIGAAPGFTLTELVVTMVVLAILTVVAVPSFSGLIARQRARNASLDLSVTVTLARSEAAKRNASVTVSAASGWASGWVLSTGGTSIRTFGPYDGVSIVPSAGNTFTIGTDGRPTAGTITFLVTPVASPQNPSCVQVGGGGRISVASGSCA